MMGSKAKSVTFVFFRFARGQRKLPGPPLQKGGGRSPPTKGVYVALVCWGGTLPPTKGVRGATIAITDKSIQEPLTLNKIV